MQDYQTQLVQYMYPRNTLIDYFMDFINEEDLKDRAQDMYRFYIFSDFFIHAKSKGIRDLHIGFGAILLTIMQNTEAGYVHSEVASKLTDMIHVIGFEEIEPILWVLQNCPRNELYFRNPDDRRVVSTLTDEFVLYNGVFKKLQNCFRYILPQQLQHAFTDITNHRRQLSFSILESLTEEQFDQIDAVHIFNIFQSFEYNPQALDPQTWQKIDISPLFRYVLVFKVFVWVFFCFVKRFLGLSILTEHQALQALSGCLLYLGNQLKGQPPAVKQISFALEIQENVKLAQEFQFSVSQIAEKLVSLNILKKTNQNGKDSILHAKVIHMNLFRMAELLKEIVQSTQINPLVYLDYYNEDMLISDPDSIYIKKRNQIYQREQPQIEIAPTSNLVIDPQIFSLYGASLSPRENMPQKTASESNLDLYAQFEALLKLTENTYMLESILPSQKFKSMVTELIAKLDKKQIDQILKRKSTHLTFFLEYSLQRTILSFISLNHLGEQKTTEFIHAITHKQDFLTAVLVCVIFTLKSLYSEVEDSAETRSFILSVFSATEGCMLRFLKILEYFANGLLGKLNPLLFRRLRKVEAIVVNSVIWEEKKSGVWELFQAQIEEISSPQSIEKATGILYELHHNFYRRLLSISASKFDSLLRKSEISLAQKNCIWNLFRLILACKPEQAVQSSLSILQTCAIIVGSKIFSKGQHSDLNNMNLPKQVKIRLNKGNKPRTIIVSFEEYYNKIFLGFNQNIVEQFTKEVNRNPALSPYGVIKGQLDEEELLELSQIVARRVMDTLGNFNHELFHQNRTLVDQLKQGENSHNEVQYELLERMRRVANGQETQSEEHPMEIETSELEYRFGETPNAELVELERYIRKKVGAESLDVPMHGNLTLLRNLENEVSDEGYNSLLVPRMSSSMGTEEQMFEKGREI